MTNIRDRRLKDGFQVDMAVEVQIAGDDKLAGAWFEAKILEIRNEGKEYFIEYAELYIDEEQTQREQEWIKLQYIRTRPPELQVRIDDLNTVKVGDAVEMLVDDGWWEGVVHQIEADGNITAHFPETDSYELINQQLHDDLSKESKKLRKGLKFKDGIWRPRVPQIPGQSCINRVGSSNQGSSQKHAGTSFAFKVMNKSKHFGSSACARNLPESSSSSEDNLVERMERTTGMEIDQKSNLDNRNDLVGKQNGATPSALKRPIAQERNLNKKVKMVCDKPKQIKGQQQHPSLKRASSCHGDIVAQRNRQNNQFENKQMQRPISAQHQTTQQQTPSASRPKIMTKLKNPTLNKSLINVKKEAPVYKQAQSTPVERSGELKSQMNCQKDATNSKLSALVGGGPMEKRSIGQDKVIQRPKSTNDLVKDSVQGKVLKRQPQDVEDNARPTKKLKIAQDFTCQAQKDGEVGNRDDTKLLKEQPFKRSNSEFIKEKPAKFFIPMRSQTSNKIPERVRMKSGRICLDNLGYLDPKDVETELKLFLGGKFISIKFRSCEIFNSSETNKKLILGGWACLTVSNEEEIPQIIKDLNQMVWKVPNSPIPRPMVAHKPIFKDEDKDMQRNFFKENSKQVSKRFFPGHNHLKLAMGPHFYQAGSLEWAHGAEWVQLQVQLKQIKSATVLDQIFQIKELLQKHLKIINNGDFQYFISRDHKQFSDILWLKNFGGDVTKEDIGQFFKQYQNRWVDDQNQSKQDECQWVKLIRDPVYGYIREALVQMKSEAIAMSVMKDLTYMMACLEGPFRPICGQLAYEGGPTGFQSVFDAALQTISSTPQKHAPIRDCKLCKFSESGFDESAILCAEKIQQLLLGNFLMQKWEYIQQKRKEEMHLHNMQQSFFEQKQELLRKLEGIFSNQKFQWVVQSQYARVKYPSYSKASKRYTEHDKQ